MGISLRDYLWKNRKRFNKEEFSKRLKIRPNYLSRICGGQCLPSMMLAKKIEVETNGEVKWSELMEFCYNIMEEEKG